MSRADGERIQCQWGSCTRKPTFSRGDSLARHVESKHMDMRKPCPLDCGVVLSRADKVRRHLVTKHGVSRR